MNFSKSYNFKSQGVLLWSLILIGNTHQQSFTPVKLDGVCFECQGTGKEYQDVKIGWLNCTGRHIARIAQNLPNPRAVSISSGAVRFEFDGGEGLLMGIANEDEGP